MNRRSLLALTLLPLFLGLISGQLQAQSLTLLNIDPSGFPTLSADLYAFDAGGTQVGLTPSDILLTENGEVRPVLSITCPPLSQPKALSSVLVVDVSGSMKETFGGVDRNIDLAKAAASAWVNALPLGRSECAVTSFDNFNYLNQDFTTDRSLLLSAVQKLSPQGSTDYNMGLLLPVAGGLEVAKKGTHQKVIVFLTDGFPMTQTNVANIVAEANRQNCIIHVVTLQMPCPPELQQIANQTGGSWTENVTSVSEAEAVYRRLLQVAQSEGPCRITWDASLCNPAEREVKVDWNGTIATGGYTAPSSGLASLEFNPTSIYFRSKKPLQQHDTVVTVKAVNGDFTVTNITSSNGAFDINPKSFSLNAGQSRQLTISFTPADSSYTWTDFSLETDLCSQHVYASGGFPGVLNSTAVLKVEHPNGGEAFPVFSDTVITWSGIPPNDSVYIEYSIDNGTTWKEIVDGATGGSYDWHVPNTPSTQCLVRVTRYDKSVDTSGLVQKMAGTRNGAFVSIGPRLATSVVEWSPDGGRIATYEDDRNIRIWKVLQGSAPIVLSGHTNFVFTMNWSPDGTKLASGGLDNTAIIWDAATGSKIQTLTGYSGGVSRVAWSHDGKYLAAADRNGVVMTWDVASGAKLQTVNPVPGPIPVTDLQWSPVSDELAIGWGVTALVSVYNGVTGTKISDIDIVTSAEYFPFCYFDWTLDGTQLCIVGGSTDAQGRVANVSDGSVARTLLTNSNNGGLDIKVSPDGTRVALCDENGYTTVFSLQTGAKISQFLGSNLQIGWSGDGSMIAGGLSGSTGVGLKNLSVWNAVTGNLIREFYGHTGEIYDIKWSPDPSLPLLASASVDGTVRIWSFLEPNDLQDVSDAVFSIVEPKITAIDIDLGKVLVGSSKDSVVADFLKNAGSYLAQVDSMQFQGASAPLFGVVSGAPPLELIPNGTAPIEFRFAPTAVGVRSAQVLIYTPTQTKLYTITGEGVAPELAIVEEVIDFGQVAVNAPRDTLKAKTITNRGTAPITITGTRHAGPNDIDFSTIAGGGSFVLNPGDTAELDLRFLPQVAGRTSGRLLFDYNGPGSPATVQLYGEGVQDLPVLALATPVIDFGKVQINTPKDSLGALTVYNAGTVPVTIDKVLNNGPNTGDFAILSSTGSVVILPGDTAQIDLRFQPSAVGATQGSLLYSYNGSTAALRVDLLGEGVDVVILSSATLATDDYSAMPGETIEIPVRLRRSANIEASGATHFTTRLRFDATLLEPINGTPTGTIVGDDRLIELDLPVTATPDSILATYSFRVGLGRDSTTTLLLEDAASVDGVVAMSVEVGTFHLLGICHAGGARLINPNGMVSLKVAGSNVIENGTALIDMETIEIGETTLSLFDLTGRPVRTYIDGEVAPGRHLLQVDVDALPSGTYFLLLQTPTERRSVVVEVVR